jgi:hypothetical protein
LAIQQSLGIAPEKAMEMASLLLHQEPGGPADAPNG